MHYLTRLTNRKLLFFPVICFLFLSCHQKESTCEPTMNLPIEVNSPLIEGWNLNLKTDAINEGHYIWSGPNGWKYAPVTISNQDFQQSLNNVTSQNAGEYSVKVYDYLGCLAGEGKVNVEVIAPPPPPCNLTPNTSTSSVIGVGDYTFVNPYFTSSSGNYLVSGSESGDFIRFGFWGQNRPIPGIYEITDGYFGQEYGTVGLFIQSGGYQFLADSGNVYVNKKSNGKLSVSICNVKFSNPIKPSQPIYVSANLTEQ
jgi:hypothetical protein